MIPHEEYVRTLGTDGCAPHDPRVLFVPRLPLLLETADRLIITIVCSLHSLEQPEPIVQTPTTAVHDLDTG